MTPTSVLLLAAAIVATVTFVLQRLRWSGTPTAAPVAPPKGSARAGVLYAFTVAFAPGAKESASRHLPSYAAGVVFHLAVFTMLATLLASVAGARIPGRMAVALAVTFGAGAACGIALLVKRLLRPELSAISVPDDLLANALVDVALVAGLAASVAPASLPVFQVTGVVLLLYAPMGKLRHAVFLFSSRHRTGAHFGRRGVRPVPRAIGGPRG